MKSFVPAVAGEDRDEGPCFLDHSETPGGDRTGRARQGGRRLEEEAGCPRTRCRRLAQGVRAVLPVPAAQEAAETEA